MSSAVARQPATSRRRTRSGRAVVGAGVALIGIAALLAWVARPGTTRSQPPTPTTVVTGTPEQLDVSAQQRDALAASPMTNLEPAAALPHPLDPDDKGDAITLPQSTASVAGVDSGFGFAPAGALAQLAAIDEAALDGMNLAQATNVYTAFADPGTDPVDGWSVYRFISNTLASAGIPGGSSSIDATYSVSAAQVKGALDNGRFVLGCVDGEFDLWLNDVLTRVGAADCARMVWTEHGWRIGAGSQPAEPPNAWPGTADAARAGWRPITRER